MRGRLIQYLAAASLTAGVFGPARLAAASSFTIIHSFTGPSVNNDGEEPEDAPAVAASGAIFGATAGGGQYQQGAIYMFTPPAKKGGNWTGGTIYSFGGISTGGLAPKGRLLLAADGSIYGATKVGGANGQGTIFHLVLSGSAWTEQTLFDFDATTPGGWAPEAGVTLGKTGVLYGVANAGGTDNEGVVFQLTPGSPRWSETVLHSFASGGTDGTLPSYGALVLDAKGRLYGTTQSGGVNGGGTAYLLTPPKTGGTTWNETILHSFGAAGDGETLEGGLILGPGGVVYGTTDGTNNSGSQGIVFSLSPPAKGGQTWTESILYDFAQAGPDGSYPRAGVLRDQKGDLYCLTNNGGANSLGTAFRLTRASGGAYTATDLYDFTPAANKVFGTLTAGKGGVYYGVTYNATGAYGTVFSLKP